RPDLKAPSLDISVHEKSLVAPGHIFIAPSFTAEYKPDSAPYIFSNNGDLIWSGLAATGGAGHSDIQGLHVCTYQSSPHLCYWHGQQRGMYGSGIGVIMNRHYQILKTVSSNSSGKVTSGVDLHEFRLAAGRNSALFTIYQPKFHEGLWVQDSCFQEIDIEDGEILFEWCSMDYVGVEESQVPVASFRLAGNGQSSRTAWDYFHLNAIDRTDSGDYLISARHLNSIFKISGTDGSILWRLGGNSSTFTFENYNFRRQHDARILKSSSTHTTLSFFNNDNDGFILKSNPSTGLLVELDHLTNSTKLITSYSPPVQDGIASRGMGNMQVLPNNGFLLGFGENSAMCEFLPNGTAVWFAELGWKSLNYRAFKSTDVWIGEPLQPPALWTYSRSRTEPTTCYVSWNGATEVLAWRFYGADTEDGDYQLQGMVEKVGFETNYTFSGFKAWSFVEAVGLNGSIKNSTLEKTSVPTSDTVDTCGLFHCFPDDKMEAPAQFEGWNGVKSNNYKGGWDPLIALIWVEHGIVTAVLFFFLVKGFKMMGNRFKPSGRYSRVSSQENLSL
ncbi:ASST-domain-containing protein, partial [Leptodontidium sp. 2 PMI_412]